MSIVITAVVVIINIIYFGIIYCQIVFSVQLEPLVARGNPPYIPSRLFQPSTLSFSILTFLFPLLTHFICFLLFIPSHSTRIVSLCFQAGCRRRQLNLTLFFAYVDFVLYVFSS